MENTKIEKLKCDILGDFQTLWIIVFGWVQKVEKCNQKYIQKYFIEEKVDDVPLKLYNQ